MLFRSSVISPKDSSPARSGKPRDTNKKPRSPKGEGRNNPEIRKRILTRLRRMSPDSKAVNPRPTTMPVLRAPRARMTKMGNVSPLRARNLDGVMRGAKTERSSPDLTNVYRKTARKKSKAMVGVIKTRGRAEIGRAHV